MLVDMKISTKDDKTIIPIIIKQNIVCLIISNFTFSFLFSFTIDCSNLNPLTANANNAGINKIFGNNNVTLVNSIPFEIPII